LPGEHFLHIADVGPFVVNTAQVIGCQHFAPAVGKMFIREVVNGFEQRWRQDLSGLFYAQDFEAATATLCAFELRYHLFIYYVFKKSRKYKPAGSN